MDEVQRWLGIALNAFKGWAQAHFGWPGVVLVVCLAALALVWVFWHKVVKVPGVIPVAALVRRPRLTVFQPGTFGVLVADLENDESNATRTASLRSSIAAKIDGVVVERLNRRIAGIGRGTTKSLAKARRDARRYLKKTQARLVIWGYAHTVGKEPSLELRIEQAVGQGWERSKVFTYADSLHIEDRFYDEMVDVLAMTIASLYSDFLERQGGELVALLAPHAKACRQFLGNGNLPPPQRAQVRGHLAKTLDLLARHADTAEPLLEAVALRRDNLSAIVREDDPAGWAAAQHDLGLALLEVLRRGLDPSPLEEAGQAFASALEVRTLQAMPVEWAASLTGQARVLYERGWCDGEPAWWKQAEGRLRQALEALSRDRSPEEWAEATHRLAVVLRVLGNTGEDVPRLDEAARLLRAALEVRTRERSPEPWAASRQALGWTLLDLGLCDADAARLEKALAVFASVLEVRTRARSPLDWADTKQALGWALYRLGERETDVARLQAGEASLREALEGLTPANAPRAWVQAQGNWGAILQELGERTTNTDRLRQALASYQEALRIASPERFPLEHAGLRHSEAIVLLSLGRCEADGDLLEEAAQGFRELLATTPRERWADLWVCCQINLGSALCALGERESGTARLEEAARACRQALTVWKKETAPHGWAEAHYRLGWILRAIAGRKKTRRGIRVALEALLGAWEVFREGDRYMAQLTCEAIVDALHVLAAYPEDAHRTILEKYQPELNRARVWAYKHHVEFPCELVMTPIVDPEA
ncbi:tetratricopeptide repeat protein [Fundidesulfovibrio butyratiphilus]